VIDLSPLLAIGLLMVRPGTLILGAPSFGGMYAPTQVKVALVVFIGIALMPFASVPRADSTVSLVLIVGREMAIGLALGLAVNAIVAAAEMAGQLAGLQIGLSYSAIIDPSSGVRNNVVGSLYGMMATIVFLVGNVHHAFLRALGQSYEALPIGAGHIGESLPQAVMALLGLVFSFALRIAAPIIVVLVVTEIGLGLIARAAPALSIWHVAPPLKLWIGLALVGALAPAVVGVLSGSLGSVLQLGVRFAETFR
jgi:flagellar biosynthetic protein FliR